MRKTILALLGGLALAGCGYRAPMHPSYLPAETFLHDLDAHCREITLEEVKRWPSPRKWRNWILRILGGPLA